MTPTHNTESGHLRMAKDRAAILTPPRLQELVGYLNFSSGTPDPRFLRNLDELFAAFEGESGESQNIAQAVGRLLQERLESLERREPAFENVEQARGVLRLAFEVLPARYREFHRDLVFHQSDACLFGPFFMGRVCEAVLGQSGPWNEDDRIVTGAIARLNDFIGYRPVAVLRTAQRIEPYRHERVRPIPLFVRGAGVGTGRYREVVEKALEILRTTDEAILREAYFDPQLVDELALDPRAYDFDHPVNKRPNYHFGQWDPHHIDHQGRYRRFVAQQVTFDVLLERVDEHGELSRDEVLVEAAAVLAGTILMASGTSGNGPDAHDSSTTLSTLLPRIAAYRDAFYERFIESLEGEHGRRLRAEAVTGKQPLAGARQHLNQQLARRRAAQLEHVHLALLFARMGYPLAALRQAQVVPVAAARMACEIQCRLTTGHLVIDAGDLARASRLLAEIEDYLHRAIECGALVDPWNILGFQGQFSLFPSPENSVPDHRLEQLIELVDEIVGLYARLWSEAASREDDSLQAALAERMGKLARWWDQFAPTSVESIEAFSGAEAYDSAREVADALKAFHRAGAAAGDIAFWRTRVAQFNSPKAYALVVGALCQKPDLVAAMALVMQWLSTLGLVPLEQGGYSFYALAQRWLDQVCSGAPGDATSSAAQRRALVVRFFELLEANAEDYWQAPSLDLLGTGNADALDEPDEIADSEDGEGRSNLYGAAYDDMVYIDSTADGVDADMLESGPAPATDFELEQEAHRVGERLALARTVASLWKKAVLALGPNSDAPLSDATLGRWLEQATENERRLLALLRSVSQRRVPAPSPSRDSLMEFERRRAVKESLVEKIIATVIETADAARSMRAALPDAGGSTKSDDCRDDLLRGVVRQDRALVERLWPQFLERLQSQALLYLPASKGGDLARLVQARELQQLLRDLLGWLPKLGLLKETCQLLEAARLMESSNPVGHGAISEYDRLFSAGYEALVEALVAMSQDWSGANDSERADNELVECLEHLTESLLKQWLAHSRTLRLSVLERIADDKAWQALKQFIERYGGDLFTQRFLNLGNLRAILHQGVGAWLDRLADDERRDEYDFRLLDDIGESISPAEAVKHLTLVIEAIVENYAEYRDYNSTTTQSDRGEMLYTLLDFLRLRVQYDRVAWHLKPVLIAHAVMVRRGRSAAAETWRRALAERTAELAEKLQNHGAELRKTYAMRLPTVTDRLAERFVRPLVIDRARALVKPAMDEVRAGGASSNSFELLEQEIDELTQEPTGVGLEVPAWLALLEQEVAGQSRDGAHLDREEAARRPLGQAKLTAEEVQRQLTGWERNPH
ncbi:MAG: hypothetical protein WD063_10255 [Pirellulales bacterium]